MPLSAILTGAFARKAWVQDSTYKRGQTFVRAQADVTAVVWFNFNKETDWRINSSTGSATALAAALAARRQ